eukprot:6641919-Prymnesium_polylepis.1
MHGGMPPLARSEAPEYCAHRRECFPNWHRPYMMEFERALRRADLALGNDGSIGLPYWGWEETEIVGVWGNEVLPGVVRQKLMEEFPPDFFPVTPSPSRHDYKMWNTRSDAQIAQMFDRNGLGALANASLHSVQHRQHATVGFSNNRNVSIETPHNMVHGIVGGIMAAFQSSFHPVFWLHHCNVDRYYEGYLAAQPDSAREFERHQRTLPTDPAPGFPEGPWG